MRSIRSFVAMQRERISFYCVFLSKFYRCIPKRWEGAFCAFFTILIHFDYNSRNKRILNPTYYKSLFIIQLTVGKMFFCSMSSCHCFSISKYISVELYASCCSVTNCLVKAYQYYVVCNCGNSKLNAYIYVYMF